MTERKSSPLTGLLVSLIVLMFVPIGILAVRSSAPGSAFEVVRGGSSYPASTLPFKFQHLGGEPVHHPLILNVNVVDFDGEGPSEVLVCDAQRQRVLLYSQGAGGVWKESIVGDIELASPAHTTVVDLDQDGDLDVLVAVLGDPWPTDERVGGVVFMENDGQQKFTAQYLLDDLRRVTDVQPGDLDGDGDLDLVVAEFGFTRGRVFWMENVGDRKFIDRLLLAAPGAIHVPLHDFDGDGDLDIVTVVTQEEEEIWAFVNVGRDKGFFKPQLLTFDQNFDLGGAGLIASDLDQDGDQDLLMAAGDNLDLLSHHPQPYHGCYWFENEGGWKFKRKRISNLGGAYAASVADIDGDDDNDVVLVSFCNDWMVDGNASVVWLENDGKQAFTTRQIADRPISLVTVDTGDLNGDGRPDIVAGGMHLAAPFDRLGRVSVWMSGEAGDETGEETAEADKPKQEETP